MSDKQFNVAVVGLGFGAEFIPIHQAHPNANMYAISRRNEAAMNELGDALGIERRYVEYEDLLADDAVDFVHINSPIEDHAWMSIEALKAGKHVMCTVPMARTIEECEQICQLVADTGLKYMMAETVVYSREFLFVKELYDNGELGKIQYLAASHPQDMDGWPEYWQRMVPMHYATHVVSPCLGMVDGIAEYVSCFGSGTVRDEIREKTGIFFFRADLPHQVAGFRPGSAHLAVSLRHRPPIPREHRRLRQQAKLRVDAGRKRTDDSAHCEEAGAGDSFESRGARLRASPAGGDTQVHAEHRRCRPPVVRPRWRPWRVASAHGARVSIGSCRGPGPVAQRCAISQLDLRRPLCARVGGEGWPIGPPARIHADANLTSFGDFRYRSRRTVERVKLGASFSARIACIGLPAKAPIQFDTSERQLSPRRAVRITLKQKTTGGQPA